MATIAQSRMTQAEAQAALAAVDEQLAAHAKICATCRAARDGSGFRIWHVCEPTGRELVRTYLALHHRLHYLAARERKGHQRSV
jgi:hypothetical protein